MSVGTRQWRAAEGQTTAAGVEGVEEEMLRKEAMTAEDPEGAEAGAGPEEAEAESVAVVAVSLPAESPLPWCATRRATRVW
jgi:hypothetical protein